MIDSIKSIKIERLVKPTREDVRDINALLPQQADRPHFLTLREFKRVTDQKCIEMYVVRASVNEKKAIVGMASVIFYWVPTGLIAFIEEFTVDEHFRGRGLGVRLINKLISSAKLKKAKHISTYTNPKRLAANAVYQKMGFFKKETNFYRINLRLPKPAAEKEINKIRRFQNKRFGSLMK